MATNGFTIPRADPMKPVGTPGLLQWGGYVREDFLPELTGLQGARVFKQMRDNSAIVGAILFACEMLLRPVAWSCRPADDSQEAARCAAFAQHALFDDCLTPWYARLSDILSMLPFGWALCEWTLKRRRGPTRDPWTSSRETDGLLGFADISLRSQDSLLQWVIDDQDQVLAMVQQPPAGGPVVTIPRAKTLLFRPTVYKSNPEGRSVLRTAYRSWYNLTHIENIEGIGIERDLAGLPVVKVPPELLAPDAPEQARTLLETYKKLATNIRRDEQEGIVFPLVYDQDGRELYKLELLSTGGRRQFDAQPLDTNILTPTGWKRMGDMQVGDAIIDPLGSPSVVLGVFPKGTRPVYRVTFADGRSTLADANHRWTVTNCQWRRRQQVQNAPDLLPQYKVLRTHEIVEQTRQKRRFHVPPITPVTFASRAPLPLDPYVLGVLLGDGYVKTKGNPRFWSADQDLLDEVERCLPAQDYLRIYRDANAGAARCVSICGHEPLRRRAKLGSFSTLWNGSATKKALQALGMLGRTAQDKSIPTAYLWSAMHDRLSLLQGLMDTDGTIDHAGFSSFGTTSQALHTGVLHLIRSLGGNAGVHIRPMDDGMVPRPGGAQPHVGTSIYYWLKNIRLPKEMQPFRLPRKAQRLRSFKMIDHNAIKSIVPAGEAEVQCLLVSAPSHMYICDDFIPTHNTDTIIKRYELRIAQSVLADMILIGHEAVGSYALSSSKTNLFASALGGYLRVIDEVLTREALPVLWDVNGLPRALLPTLQHGDVEHVDLRELSEAVKNLAQAGFNIEDLADPVRLKMGLPVAEEDV